MTKQQELAEIIAKKDQENKEILERMYALLKDGMSVRQAASLASKGTHLTAGGLISHYRSEFDHPNHSRNLALTTLQEQVLLSIVGQLESIGDFSSYLTSQDVLDLANTLFRTKDNALGHHWLDNFLARHPVIPSFSSNPTQDIHEFLRIDQELVEKHWIDRFIHHLGSKDIVLVSEQRIPVLLGDTLKTVGFIPFIRSNGQHIMDVFVLPSSSQTGNGDQVQVVRNSDKNVHSLYCFTPDANLNNSQWIECLDELVIRLGNDKNVLLLYDSESFNQDLEVKIMAQHLKHQLEFHVLPKFGQSLSPMKALYMAKFQEVLPSAIRDQKVHFNGSERGLGTALLKISEQVRNCLQSDVIQSSFAHVGLQSPLNVEKMISTLKNGFKETVYEEVSVYFSLFSSWYHKFFRDIMLHSTEHRQAAKAFKKRAHIVDEDIESKKAKNV
jgi:hypothetical protein